VAAARAALQVPARRAVARAAAEAAVPESSRGRISRLEIQVGTRKPGSTPQRGRRIEHA
jgi:hypothetical protein